MSLTANFLSGPVDTGADVREALQDTPISHRSSGFAAMYDGVRRRLCHLVKAEHCALMLGSGTLANDAIAARLKGEGGRGFILSRGEFGDRLADHARRFGLDYTVAGEIPGHAEGYDWIWAVHCETSTGQLVDLEQLKSLAKRIDARLCLDCISTIGAIDLDLSGVYLASGTSGKALASVAGVAMVFHGDLMWCRPVPRYLDLKAYADGAPFTFPSQLLAALDSALGRPLDYAIIAAHAEMLRRRARDLGLEIIEAAAPHVTTIQLPPSASSRAVGDALADKGLLVSYESDYLQRDNRIQICLMGAYDPARISEVLDLIARAVNT